MEKKILDKSIDTSKDFAKITGKKYYIKVQKRQEK